MRPSLSAYWLALVSFVCYLWLMSVLSANAWTISFEFGDAKNQWGYMQYGQMGRNGFFGPYDVDNSTVPGLYGNLNSWLGNSTDVNQISSGSNGAVGQYSVNADSNLGTEWIRLKGRYNINLYQTGTSQGAFNPMSPSFLTMWYLDVDLPIFTVGYGKRPFRQAMGLQFGFNRSSEYLVFERDFIVPDLLGALVAKGILPRGVLSYFNPLGWGRYKTEVASEDAEPKPTDDEWPKMNGSYAGGALSSAGLKIGFGMVPWQTLSTAAFTQPLIFTVNPFNTNDASAGVEQNWIAYILYTSTDFNAAIGTTRTVLHAGPELLGSTLPIVRNHTPTQELYFTEGWAYFAYNNGSLFCSAELDWYNRIFRTMGTYDGLMWDPTLLAPVSPIDPVTGVSRFAPQYVESWRFAAEAGLFFGPTSVRCMFAYMPGQDRRHGILIDRQPFIQFRDQAATEVFDPYSIHLNYLFGGGVQAPQHINAATVFGLKVDHMLASNLVVFGTFLKAYRNAQGYGLGFVRPSLNASGSVDYNIRGTYVTSSPSIPDNDLGWEATTGFTWQLGNCAYVDARFTYWQPGKWFNHACIDRSVTAWDTPGPFNNWGVNASRTIDPFFGIELRLAVSY